MDEVAPAGIIFILLVQNLIEVKDIFFALWHALKMLKYLNLIKHFLTETHI